MGEDIVIKWVQCALCTVQAGALWEKILPSYVCTVHSGQDGGCSVQVGQMIVQAVSSALLVLYGRRYCGRCHRPLPLSQCCF